LDESREVVGQGTTAILFTPRDMQSGLADRMRGGMLVFPADEMGRRMFQFSPEVEFSTCMPIDQQPKITAEESPAPARDVVGV
jgi:hypothetical protein